MDTKDKSQTRFIPVDKLQALYRQSEAIRNEIASYNPNHCRVCGDTKPKDGFYPLWSMSIGPGIVCTSGFMCNECAWPKKRK